MKMVAFMNEHNACMISSSRSEVPLEMKYRRSEQVISSATHSCVMSKLSSSDLVEIMNRRLFESNGQLINGVIRNFMQNIGK